MTPQDKELAIKWHDVWERIRPYHDEEVKTALQKLQSDPDFQSILQLLPNEIVHILQSKIPAVESVDQFRRELVAPLLCDLLSKSIFSYEISGKSRVKDRGAVTFLSNHRDILLDAAILNLCLFEADLPLVRMAVGDNLLANSFIMNFMRLSDAILVERGLPPREFIKSSRGFSAYIDWSLRMEGKSLWIAQREGRAKDNNDTTQPSLLKMLTLEGDGDSLESRLISKRIVPMTISYEYDPCDYLKARELLARKRDGSYTKAPGEDVNSMKQGLLGAKGRVHIDLGIPLEDLIAKAKESNLLMDESLRRPNEYFADIASIIDREIHSRYRLYPGNYIAEDNLSHATPLYRAHYSDAEVRIFSDYIEERVALARPSSQDEEQEIRKLILLQYANPLRNYYKARRKTKRAE